MGITTHVSTRRDVAADMIRLQGVTRQLSMGGEVVHTLLLADEPTGNLDNRVVEEVMS